MDISEKLDAGEFNDNHLSRIYQDLNAHFERVSVDLDGDRQEVVVHRYDSSDDKALLDEVKDVLGSDQKGIIIEVADKKVLLRSSARWSKPENIEESHVYVGMYSGSPLDREEE